MVRNGKVTSGKKKTNTKNHEKTQGVNNTFFGENMVVFQQLGDLKSRNFQGQSHHIVAGGPEPGESLAAWYVAPGCTS